MEYFESTYLEIVIACDKKMTTSVLIDTEQVII